MKDLPADYYHVTYRQPHVDRCLEMLKKYPEIKKLFGRNPWTIIPLTLTVAAHIGVGVWTQSLPWWGVIAAAWLIGAFFEHALFVLIHEASHNLLFKRPSWNKLAGILANLPGVFPSAMGFRNYHLLHHCYQGELNWDADLPGKKEAELIGSSFFKKALWLLFFPVIEGVIRPARVNKIQLFEPWALFNVVVVFGFWVASIYFIGWKIGIYFLLSLFFGVGLHPVGGRWIQEHYVFQPGQETYSYYGPLNLVSYNVGFHNEHHDFTNLTWNKLPKLRKIAPEYYNDIYYHTSWTSVLFRFLFDKKMNLFSRYVRPDRDNRPKARYTTKATQQLVSEGDSPTVDAMI